MKFKLFPAFLIFLGSYFPLAIILTLQDVTKESWDMPICKRWETCVLPISNHPYLSFFGVVTTFLCIVLTVTILKEIRYKYEVEIMDSKPVPNELISYSFPYTVSFIGIDYHSMGKLVGLVVFFIWLFWITYRAGQLIMNPILLVMGWNLYEARVEISGRQRIIRVLSKGPLTPGLCRCHEVHGCYITNNGVQGNEL